MCSAKLGQSQSRLQQYTFEEVVAANKSGNCWLLIDGASIHSGFFPALRVACSAEVMSLHLYSMPLQQTGRVPLLVLLVQNSLVLSVQTVLVSAA